jgi:GDP-L-fucose synthase
LIKAHEKIDKIFIAGHQGMVGSAVLRLLISTGFENLLLAKKEDVDLRIHSEVKVFFETNRPDYVIMAAAKVGGIHANLTYPAEFIYDNLSIQTNIINESYRTNVKKICFGGSSCVYPRECPQPIKEEYLLTGPLEPTNEAYAVAKIAGLKMAQYYANQYNMSHAMQFIRP